MFDPHKVTPSGKTYAEIDAEETKYVQEANDALASMPEEAGRWWSYTVSHCTFEMVVGSPQTKNLVLSLSGCESVSGPVDWPGQRLVIDFLCDRSTPRGSWKFTLHDDSVGFRVVAGTFLWRRNHNLLQQPSLYFGRALTKPSDGA